MSSLQCPSTPFILAARTTHRGSGAQRTVQRGPDRMVVPCSADTTRAADTGAKRCLRSYALAAVALWRCWLGPALALAGAGAWAWPKVWAYAATHILLSIPVVLHFRRQSSGDLLEERSKFIAHQDATKADRALVALLALVAPLEFLAAGLERRWAAAAAVAAAAGADPAGLLQHSSSLHVPHGSSSWATWCAWLLLVLTGHALMSWAMCTNHWFSSVVRIQRDRAHGVSDSGPYARVRHPAYLGALQWNTGTALALGPSPACTALVVVWNAALLLRTALEDATLQQELPGYSAYAARVRWRLLPGLW